MKGKPSEADSLQSYLDCIARYDTEFKPWMSRSEKIVRRYRDQNRSKGDITKAMFNILWSNVQSLVNATFSKLPQPDVSRRFSDNDPVGRVAALILERALDYEVEHYADYRTAMREVVYDRFLGGRGSVWARYEPHFSPLEERQELPSDGLQVTEDVHGVTVDEELDYECVPIDYVHWNDFGHDVARTWEEVTKVWRKVYMSEKAVRDRFGNKIAKTIPYDASPDANDRGREYTDNVKKQALIIELWDKSTGKAVWISKSMNKFLDEKDDPLKLQEFFPCPRPLYATLTNNTLVPVPDITLYQDQAKILDTLTNRIRELSNMLQVKGVYDSSCDAVIARLFTEGTNGTLLPVKNWAAFAEKNGLRGQVDVFDLAPIASALETAYRAMQQVTGQIYDITGISDIIRGQTQASETATAQQIKGQYASLRLRAFQDEVALFATDTLRLKAQIMCSKFAPQTFVTMSAVEQLSPDDQQLVPQALALLIGEERMMDPELDAPNPLRSFRVDIASDTLVQMDEQQEKRDRLEMLAAFGTYLEKATVVGSNVPDIVPLLVEVAKFGLTAFKVGKTIEGTFDNLLDQMKQSALQPKGPPPPPPEVLVEQMKQQGEDKRMAEEGQLKQMEIQAASTGEQQSASLEVQKNTDKLSSDIQIAQLEIASKERMLQMELNQKRELEMLRLTADRESKLDEANAELLSSAINTPLE